MAKPKHTNACANIQSFNFNPNLNITNQVSKALVPDGFDEFLLASLLNHGTNCALSDGKRCTFTTATTPNLQPLTHKLHRPAIINKLDFPFDVFKKTKSEK